MCPWTSTLSSCQHPVSCGSGGMQWKRPWWIKEMTSLEDHHFRSDLKLPKAMVRWSFMSVDWEFIVHFCHSLHNCTYKGLLISNGDCWCQLRRFTLTTLGWEWKGWTSGSRRQHLVAQFKSTRGLSELCSNRLFVALSSLNIYWLFYNNGRCYARVSLEVSEKSNLFSAT